MNNFTYHVYTDVRFGKDQINTLPELIAPLGKKVLLVYGGGSIKRNGIYDKIQELLSDCEIYELSGIEPNPKIESVRAGAALCKEHGIEVVLAVGGGSVIDASKVIAAAANYDGDAWDLVVNNKKIGKVLPIVAILTLAATGSEMNKNAVISNMTTNEKLELLPIILSLQQLSVTRLIYSLCLQTRLQPARRILCPMYLNSISRKLKPHILLTVLQKVF